MKNIKKNVYHHLGVYCYQLDTLKRFVSLKQSLINKGISIGIFGSLQSFPPPDFENIKFYLPDTFSPSCNAIPEVLSIFQEFNLNLVGNNNAVTRGISVHDFRNFVKCLSKNLIKPKTIVKLSTHISKERLFPKYKIRRSTCTKKV